MGKLSRVRKVGWADGVGLWREKSVVFYILPLENLVAVSERRSSNTEVQREADVGIKGLETPKPWVRGTNDSTTRAPIVVQAIQNLQNLQNLHRHSRSYGLSRYCGKVWQAFRGCVYFNGASSLLLLPIPAFPSPIFDTFSLQFILPSFKHFKSFELLHVFLLFFRGEYRNGFNCRF